MADGLGIAGGIVINPFLNPLGYVARGIYSGMWNPFTADFYNSGATASGSLGDKVKQAENTLFNSSAKNLLSYGNDYNAQQAQIQRDWEERMSSTAYQRAVADIKAAGLNPWILANGGSAASTPSGAVASSDTSAYGAAISQNNAVISGLFKLASSALGIVGKLGSSALSASSSK